MKKHKEVTAEAETFVFIEKYGRHAVLLLVLAGVAYGGYIAYDWNLNRIEKNAQEALFTIQKKVDDKTQEITKTEEEKTTKVDTKGKEKSKNKKTVKKTAKKIELEKTPESLVKNFESSLRDYESFISTHRGRKASYMAAIRLAGLSTEYKDLPRAEKILSEITVQNKGDVFYGLVKMQLGTVLMDGKKIPQAVEQLTLVIDNLEQKAFHPQALLRLGACYLEMGDYLKAESALSRLEADHPTTQAASEGKNLKRLVLLKKAEKS